MLFTNDLNLSLKKAWELLQEGCADRSSPMHSPIVASVDDDGCPSQRVMILRDIDPAERTLRFNSDIRADKISQFEQNPQVSVLTYHPDAKIQLRIGGSVKVLSQGKEVENAWDSATAYSKRCYLAHPAPGTTVPLPLSGLSPDMEGHKPEASETDAARANFSIVKLTICSIEWLFLEHTGHRRAIFNWQDDRWNGRWLIP